MSYRSRFRVLSSDLAIDLGTANTKVYVPGRGVVLDEPSVVAVNRQTGEILGCGAEAKEAIGRTPANVAAIRPVREGAIADFAMASRMLNLFIHKAEKKRLLTPRIAISVGGQATEVEKRALVDSTYRARPSHVHLVHQTLMTAVGAGLPITDPMGNMVVDIGAGKTDIAVISSSGIVYSRSLRIGGNQMDEAVISYLRKQHRLLIGERTAERIKIGIGSADALPETLQMEVRGRDLLRGLPAPVTLNDKEIRKVLSGSVASIVEAVRTAIEKTPDELSFDIQENGIILTGGVSLLRGLDSKLRKEIGMPILVAEQPLAAAILGTGRMLEDFKMLRRMSLN